MDTDSRLRLDLSDFVTARLNSLGLTDKDETATRRAYIAGVKDGLQGVRLVYSDNL